MQEIIEIIQDIDWTEETNDSGWNALNRIVHLIDHNKNNYGNTTH